MGYWFLLIAFWQAFSCVVLCYGSEGEGWFWVLLLWLPSVHQGLQILLITPCFCLLFVLGTSLALLPGDPLQLPTSISLSFLLDFMMLLWGLRAWDVLSISLCLRLCERGFLCCDLPECPCSLSVCKTLPRLSPRVDFSRLLFSYYFWCLYSCCLEGGSARCFCWWWHSLSWFQWSFSQFPSGYRFW